MLHDLCRLRVWRSRVWRPSLQSLTLQPLRTLTVGVSLALASFWAEPSFSATFGQAPLNQEKLIAIAVPRASGYYTLLVLEQLSDKKQCWRESGSRPIQVDPLLMKFDFTGICGRSTDSNGYSLRVAGQDLGMSHRLSIQKQANDLVLLGIPNSGKGAPVEVGRTNGLGTGFLKISLTPGWQFTKRTYSGKTLGHVYFSRATPAPTYQARLASGKSSSIKPSDPNPSVIKPSAIKSPALKPSALKTPETKSASTSQTSSNKKRLATNAAKPEATQVTAKRSKIKKSEIQTTQADRPKPIQPAPRPGRPALFSGKSTRGPIAAPRNPLFSSQRQASLGQQARSTSARSAQGASISVKPISVKPTSVKPAPVKLAEAKSSHQRNAQYQVIVIAPDPTQQDKVRSKMPNAFRTSYKGQMAMQVGLFSDRQKAKSLQADLKRDGFTVVLAQKKVGKASLEAASTVSRSIGSSQSSAARYQSEGKDPQVIAAAKPGRLGSITIPGAAAPLGNAKGAKNIYQPQTNASATAALPPPPPKSVQPRFRVLVNAASQDQSKIRALVPGAFWANVRGKRVMQVGSFTREEEAQAIIQVLKRNGFRPITDRS